MTETITLEGITRALARYDAVEKLRAQHATAAAECERLRTRLQAAEADPEYQAVLMLQAKFKRHGEVELARPAYPRPASSPPDPFEQPVAEEAKPKESRTRTMLKVMSPERPEPEQQNLLSPDEPEQQNLLPPDEPVFTNVLHAVEYIVQEDCWLHEITLLQQLPKYMAKQTPRYNREAPWNTNPRTLGTLRSAVLAAMRTLSYACCYTVCDRTTTNRWWCKPFADGLTLPTLPKGALLCKGRLPRFYVRLAQLEQSVEQPVVKTWTYSGVTDAVCTIVPELLKKSGDEGFLLNDLIEEFRGKVYHPGAQKDAHPAEVGALLHAARKAILRQGYRVEKAEGVYIKGRRSVWKVLPA